VPTAPAAELELTVGVDAVRPERLREVVGGDESRRRTVFTDRELAHCGGRRREYEHLAARFAAKEAVLKAFGTGVVRGIKLTDVEIVNDRGGRPRVQLAGRVAELAQRRDMRQLDVSLTHTDGIAVATAIAAWGPCASI
jgi:holo-[acyl-carrier protein] synthase